MSDQYHQKKHLIPTELPGLELIQLSQDDVLDYYQLVDRNRDHLTQHGDYLDLKQATLETVEASLTDPADANEKFGIWLNDLLIGRADLSPRVPGKVVIGYRLGSDYTGRGYATMACKALIQDGRSRLGATDIFAGVTKGNTASERLLGRLGFERVEDRGAYTLFHLTISEHE